MFQSLAIDQRSHADQTFDSWEHGWRSLLLRHFTLRLEVDEAVIPPVAEQTVVLVTDGVADFESGGEGCWRSARYELGRITMTAPNRSSRLRWHTMSAEPIQTLHLYLPPRTTARVIEELWDSDPTQRRMPDTLATTDPVLEQTMLSLLQAAAADAPDLYAESAAEFIAVHTLVRHGAFPAPREIGGEDGRIRRARSFLRENLHLPLTLAEIAAEVGMSRYHFLRVFQRETGETPHRYLIRLRIEQSRVDLEHSPATMTEIASRCGFASRTHFTAAFRRQTGYAPSAYRRLHRKRSFRSGDPDMTQS